MIAAVPLYTPCTKAALPQPAPAGQAAGRSTDHCKIMRFAASCSPVSDTGTAVLSCSTLRLVHTPHVHFEFMCQGSHARVHTGTQSEYASYMDMAGKLFTFTFTFTFTRQDIL